MLKGYGAELFFPLPAGTFGALSKSETDEYSPEKAKELLDKNGWKMNTGEQVLEKKIGKELFKFSFSISTSDAPELKETAYLLKSMWEKIGAKVDVKIFETGDLAQNIIRPRKYDALLFGEIVGRDPTHSLFGTLPKETTPALMSPFTRISRRTKFLKKPVQSRTKQKERTNTKNFKKRFPKTYRRYSCFPRNSFM